MATNQIRVQEEAVQKQILVIMNISMSAVTVTSAAAAAINQTVFQAVRAVRRQQAITATLPSTTAIMNANTVGILHELQQPAHAVKVPLAITCTVRRIKKMKEPPKTFTEKLRLRLDGKADTLFEYFMLLVVLTNTVVLGLETSAELAEKYGEIFFIIDQVCLWIFILELLLKVIAYNRHFFGEFRHDADNKDVRFFHFNKWNIFDLIIVLVSVFGSLPFFAVFRVVRLFKSVKIIKGIKSLRVIKTLKLVNGITKLRIIVKAVIKAIPSVFWTFCLLVIFAYVYAIIGVNIFGTDFPEYFGTLGDALLALFNLSSFDSTAVIKVYSWAWIYFISYNFFEASIIMNVIVGVIVDSVNTSREEIEREECEEKGKKQVTLESLSKQIDELKAELEKSRRREK